MKRPLTFTNLPYLMFVEPTTYFIFAIFSSILALAYFKESNIGSVYLGLLFADFILHQTMETKYNFFSSTGNTMKSLVMAAVGYVVIVLATGAIISVLQSTAFEVTRDIPQRIASATFGSSASAPILSEVPIVTAFVFAMFIPVIETRTLVGRLMEWLGNIFRVDFGLNPKTILVLLLLGGVSVVFHWQAKGVTNSIDLAITFLFFAGSGLLVLITKEMEAAVYLHIINNVIGIKAVLGF